MNRSSFKAFFFIFFLFTSGLSLRSQSGGQSQKVDSLRLILKTSAQDTNRVNILNNLAAEMSDEDTAISIAGEALFLSRKLKWKKGEAWAELALGVFNKKKINYKVALVHFNNALSICEILLASKNAADVKTGKKVKGKTINNIGMLYDDQSDYIKALEYYFKALQMSEELGDKKQIGRILGNIAIVYQDQSNFSKALEYYFKGLKMSEANADRDQVGMTLSNIGNMYAEQSDYPKALEYFFKSLKIAEEDGDTEGIGKTLGNIGNVYSDDENYPKAQEYYFKSLKIIEEAGDKRALGLTFTNLAILYKKQGDSAASKGNIIFAKANKYSKALEYYFKGLKIAQEVLNKNTIANAFNNIGLLYAALAKYKEAEDYFNKALLISKEIGAGNLEKDHHNNLSGLYETTNRPALALEHYKKFIALRDTIFSLENNKKLMRVEMDHEYEKKKAVTDAEHNMEIQNQKLITNEKNKKQNIIIGSVIAGLILVMIFAGFVFRSLRTTRKQKQIIELKNIETELQKKEIEEHQRDILDSIHYAKRIQMAQIPSEKRVGNILQRLRKL